MAMNFSFETDLKYKIRKMIERVQLGNYFFNEGPIKNEITTRTPHFCIFKELRLYVSNNLNKLHVKRGPKVQIVIYIMVRQSPISISYEFFK